MAPFGAGDQPKLRTSQEPFWQRRRVDSPNIFDVQKFHAATSLGMAAYAIGIEEVAFGGVGDQIEDSLCLVYRC